MVRISHDSYGCRPSLGLKIDRTQKQRARGKTETLEGIEAGSSKGTKLMTRERIAAFQTWRLSLRLQTCLLFPFSNRHRCGVLTENSRRGCVRVFVLVSVWLRHIGEI